ncbi:hypothetical protein [Entomohabitans teleogrylli]|uniref:hypothetical protein n=1 Tax=Entomohabitans teleogrylli TaxID=1384589 RepID=UPI00073D2C35|nr:hypothetical protein [Entomohabitans teleogrylli]
MKKWQLYTLFLPIVWWINIGLIILFKKRWDVINLYGIYTMLLFGFVFFVMTLSVLFAVSKPDIGKQYIFNLIKRKLIISLVIFVIISSFGWVEADSSPCGWSILAMLISYVTFCFASWKDTRVVTPGYFNDNDEGCDFNPTTGLYMNGGVDVEGNSYGHLKD